MSVSLSVCLSHLTRHTFSLLISPQPLPRSSRDPQVPGGPPDVKNDQMCKNYQMTTPTGLLTCTHTPYLPNYNLQGPPQLQGPPGPWGTPRCNFALLLSAQPLPPSMPHFAHTLLTCQTTTSKDPRSSRDPQVPGGPPDVKNDQMCKNDQMTTPTGLPTGNSRGPPTPVGAVSKNVFLKIGLQVALYGTDSC